ncbi:unnamed protein product [Trifolium pratense]|uniref:Uncharacterized protein n=1 Tax=Trifolium pratense TaxID=57577 RepID=A0ACB0MF05_TRIPR|nr:unnamed protein product [Trifolium pratense]
MLTEGGILGICSDDGERLNQVVLQVIDVKPLQTPPLAGTVDGYRGLTFSDGSHCIVGFITKKLEELVQYGKLKIGSIVALTHYFFSQFKNRKVLIIMELEIASFKCDYVIGKPVPLHNLGEILPVGNVPLSYADEDLPNRSQAKEKRKKRTAKESIPRLKLALTKKAELEKVVSELCTAQYKLGFKNAQAQAVLLSSVGDDLSAMNMLKVVKNGEIVSDDEEEEE